MGWTSEGKINVPGPGDSWVAHDFPTSGGSTPPPVPGLTKQGAFKGTKANPSQGTYRLTVLDEATDTVLYLPASELPELLEQYPGKVVDIIERAKLNDRLDFKYLRGDIAAQTETSRPSDADTEKLRAGILRLLQKHDLDPGKLEFLGINRNEKVVNRGQVTLSVDPDTETFLEGKLGTSEGNIGTSGHPIFNRYIAERDQGINLFDLTFDLDWDAAGYANEPPTVYTRIGGTDVTVNKIPGPGPIHNYGGRPSTRYAIDTGPASLANTQDGAKFNFILFTDEDRTTQQEARPAEEEKPGEWYQALTEYIIYALGVADVTHDGFALIAEEFDEAPNKFTVTQTLDGNQYLYRAAVNNVVSTGGLSKVVEKLLQWQAFAADYTIVADQGVHVIGVPTGFGPIPAIAVL